MSTADYFIKLPEEVQLSDPPLSGMWYIKTYNTFNSPCFTNDMPLTYTADQVTYALWQDCSFLFNAVVAKQVFTPWSDSSVGISFELDFFGINGELKQYEIFTSTSDPLNNASLLEFGAEIT